MVVAAEDSRSIRQQPSHWAAVVNLVIPLGVEPSSYSDPSAINPTSYPFGGTRHLCLRAVWRVSPPGSGAASRSSAPFPARVPRTIW